AIALMAGAGLAFAGGSLAQTSHHRARCGPGYVRRSVRVPERIHGRIVRHNGKIVYTRLQRCVKVKPKPKPPPPTLPPAPPATIPPPTFAPVVPLPTTTTLPPSSPPQPQPPPPPPPPSSADACPTDAPGSTQSVGGNTYALEGMDTFTKDAPLGSFALPAPPPSSSLDPIGSVVYTGDHGMAWAEYP